MVFGKESKLSFLKGNVLIITLGNSLEQFSRMAAFPYLSLFVLDLGGNPQNIGIISSLRPLSSFFTYPLAGYFADRMGRVKLIVFWTYVITAIYGFYVIATNWLMVAIGTFLMGFIVFQLPAKSAIMADSLDPKHRGVGFAISTTVPGAVAVVSPYIAGYLIDKIGAGIAVRYLYALHMFMLFASTTLYWKFLKDTVVRRDEKLELANLPKLIKEAYFSAVEVIRWAPTNLKAFAIVIGMGLTANAIAGPFWVVYATRQIGLSTTEWGSIFFLYSIVNLTASIPAGAIIDRCGKRKIILASFVLSLPPLLYFTRISGFIDALIVMLTLSLANSFLAPASRALMADLAPRELRGKVMAAFGQGTITVNPRGGGGSGPQVGYAFSLPITLGSIIGGYVYAAKPIYPWIFQSILTIMSIILSYIFVHEPQKAEI